jgi:hypothetical protein
MSFGRIGLKVNLTNLVVTKADIAAKRHPGEIDSVFHWAGKMHKNNNLHIGISNSYGHQKYKFGLHIPNEKTMKAIENSRQGKGRQFSTPQGLFNDLGI